MNYQKDLSYFGLSPEQVNNNLEILKFLYREKSKACHSSDYLNCEIFSQQINETEFQKLMDSYTNLSKRYYECLSNKNRLLKQDENNDQLNNIDFENLLIYEQTLYYEQVDLISLLTKQVEKFKERYQIESKPKTVITPFQNLENKKQYIRNVYVNMLTGLEEEGYDLALHLMIFMEQKYDDFSLEIVLKEFANTEVKKKNSGIQR